MDPNYPMAPTPPPLDVPPLAPEPQPTGTPDAPKSYTDVIAEQESKKPKFLSKKIILIAAGVLAILILAIIIGVIVNNINRAAHKEVITLDSQLTDLQYIIDYRKDNTLNDSATRIVASEADIIAATHRLELSGAYSAVSNEIDLSKDTDSYKAATSNLNDAKAHGNLDSIYAETLRSQLLLVSGQLDTLYKSAKDDQKETLKNASDDFKELASRLPTS